MISGDIVDTHLKERYLPENLLEQNVIYLKNQCLTKRKKVGLMDYQKYLKKTKILIFRQNGTNTSINNVKREWSLQLDKKQTQKMNFWNRFSRNIQFT